MLQSLCVLKPFATFVFFFSAFLSGACAAPVAGQQSQEPPVKVNILNVCAPSAEEQAVLKTALSRVSGNPAFAEDFEISRGRASLKDSASKFVRLRRDFAALSPMMTAQYSISMDDKATIETLVLRMRDPKEFHEISIEDRVSSEAASPVSIVATDTPAARIRIERLGKNSVVLARCEAADQSANEPLFAQASDLMAKYRGALGLRTTFRSDIAWLAGPAKRSSNSVPSKKP